MAEQVQQQKTLHLEADVRIDHDAQPVEDSGARRLEIPILDGEAVLDDAGRDLDPEIDEVVAGHLADQSRPDDLVAREVRAHARSLLASRLPRSTHPLGTPARKSSLWAGPAST